MTDVQAIDVHSHWVPPGYAAALRSEMERLDPRRTSVLRSVRDSSNKMRDLSVRLTEMDEAGVVVSVLSLPPPGVTMCDPDRRAALARLANDEFLEAASDYGGRLAVLAALPLPDVAQSVAEIERIASHSCARGINLQATTEAGWTIDDPTFDPVYLRAAALGLPVLVHPAVETLPSAWNQHLLAATLAPMVSSSLGAARLILSGTLDRVPELDVIVPHLGGVLPYLKQRFEDFGPGQAAHDFGWYLRSRLYVDTCSFHPPAFRCAVDTCGVDRLVMGTDYPIRGPLSRAVADICSSLSSEVDRHAVLGGTAGRWFGPNLLVSN
jgi:predicted TIM-barrel fold metal-dependent hydrolase